MNKLAVNIGANFSSPFGQTKTLGDLITLATNTALIIAGLVVLFLMVFGGLSMIIGAGNNDPQSAARGKQAATYAVIGFVVIFVAYWVIQFIEAITGLNFITAPVLN